MPLGASRVNGISYVVSSAPTLPAGQAVVATNINYSYADYSVNNVVYVGPDSSSRPVFYFAYSNTSNHLRATLFRINDDGTITQGAEQSAGTQSVFRTVKSASEYEGAGSFGNGTPGSVVYMCYENSTPNATFAQVASINQDALTCTFGTAVNISMTPDADQPYCAYVGNSRAVFGARTGGGATFKRYSRSTTTLTSEGTASADAVFRIDSDAVGFLNNGSTQYRYGFFNTSSGASGVTYGAQTMGATNYSTTNSSITTSSQARGASLTNASKMLGGYNNGGVINLRGLDITWNASSNPTISIGSSATFSDMAAVGGSFAVVAGHNENEGFAIYNGSTSTLDYRTVSASGTTLTLGSKVTMITGISNIYYSMSATSAKIGTKTYLAGINVRSSGAPYIFGYRLA